MSFIQILSVYAGAAAFSSSIRTVYLASTSNFDIKINERPASTVEKLGIFGLSIAVSPITEPLFWYGYCKALKDGSYTYEYKKDE